MSVSPFDSNVYGELLSDRETAVLFSDAAHIHAMLLVEAALARVQGRLGIIPGKAAARISEVAATLEIPPESLAAGTASAGVPVPALVAALREAAGAEAGQYVHWGATSQDIVDTALVLGLRDMLGVFTTRLDAVIAALAEQADRHRGAVMAGRTRWQQAAPTTLGLKIAVWLDPLIRHRNRLAELRPRLLAVQFGGAAGTLAALGDNGIAVMEALAAELDLAAPPAPWCAQRDSIVECAGWLALVTGSLGKIGQDLMLLAQSEVGEVRAGSGGGSSTMPQKANPVAGEALVALARTNAGLLGAMHQAMLTAQERDGAAWMAEWLTLPQMAVAAGAALKHARTVAETLAADAERMARNLDDSNELILAEAATFALAEHMPRPAAAALVKSACGSVGQGRSLTAVLRENTDAPVDWDTLADPARYLGAADQLIDRVLAAARAKPTDAGGRP